MSLSSSSVFYFFFFFFSSRRRHTRWNCDWSSDVCSSDLEGRELRHPKTGEVLGRTEQAVGRMVVQQVLEAYATGTLSQAGAVQAGDKARVSAGKVKLRALPISEGHGVKGGLVEAAIHELIGALKRTGRFQVGMGDAIGVWLTQQGIKRDDVLAGKGLAQSPNASRSSSS